MLGIYQMRDEAKSSAVSLLTGIVQNFHDKRILVIGDVILDQYIWGNADRISPEAPVPVVTVTKETYRLGGAANAAANICSLGCGGFGTPTGRPTFPPRLPGLNACTPIPAGTLSMV